MNYVEQFNSTIIRLRAFEDTLAETMVLIKIFVTLFPPQFSFTITDYSSTLLENKDNAVHRSG